jgi:hypothetical protein
LDPNDRFGVFEPLTQPGIFAAQLAEIGVRRLSNHGFGAASQRFERLERAGIALAAPIGQGRRIKAFAAQNGGDPAGIGSAVGLLQDAQLGRRGERPALGPWREFGRLSTRRRGRGGRRRHRRRLAARLRTGSVRQFDWAIWVGHNHEVILLCPRLNSKGAGVSSSLAQRAVVEVIGNIGDARFVDRGCSRA